MFYTGLDPRDMKPVYVPRDPEEKAMQRALMHFFKPYNHAMVIAALKKAGREDLIGWTADCLVPPYLHKPKSEQEKMKVCGKNEHGKARTGEKGRQCRPRSASEGENRGMHRERGPKHPTKGGGKPSGKY